MLRKHNPGAIAPAFSSYSLAVEAPAQARWLHISGQVGVEPDGAFADFALHLPTSPGASLMLDSALVFFCLH